eukprot:664009-Ditylum_brightwellii.AAC.1
MLQHMTGKIAVGLGINVSVECTPKCHPELSGRGIGYTWANSKIYPRGVPLKSRKACARDFIVTYHILEQKGVGKSASGLNVLSFAKAGIERSRKKYRSQMGCGMFGYCMV